MLLALEISVVAELQLMERQPSLEDPGAIVSIYYPKLKKATKQSKQTNTRGKETQNGNRKKAKKKKKGGGEERV